MKNKQKITLLLLLVVVLVGINLVRRSSSAPAPQATSPAVPARSAGARDPLAIPDAVLQVGRLEAAAHRRAADVRRNIFEYGRRAETPVSPGQAVSVAPPQEPPPPPAPVRFFGFAENSRGGKRQVFLTDGEEIFVAAEGDVIARRYRLLRVESERIEVEELAGKRRWVVPLEQP